MKIRNLAVILTALTCFNSYSSTDVKRVERDLREVDRSFVLEQAREARRENFSREDVYITREEFDRAIRGEDYGVYCVSRKIRNMLEVRGIGGFEDVLDDSERIEYREFALICDPIEQRKEFVRKLAEERNQNLCSAIMSLAKNGVEVPRISKSIVKSNDSYGPINLSSLFGKPIYASINLNYLFEKPVPEGELFCSWILSKRYAEVTGRVFY